MPATETTDDNSMADDHEAGVVAEEGAPSSEDATHFSDFDGYDTNHPIVTLTLRFIDPEGSPVPGVEFAYDRSPVMAGKTRFNELAIGKTLRADVLTRDYEYAGRANSQGVAAIATRVPAEIALAVTTPGWAVGGALGMTGTDGYPDVLKPHIELPGEALLHLKQGTPNRAYDIVLIEANATVDTEIVYADGTSFEGVVGLSVSIPRRGDPEDLTMFRRLVELRKGERLALGPLPNDSRVSVQVEHWRLEFDNPAVFKVALSSSPNKLVIPYREEPLGRGFILELPPNPDGESTTASVDFADTQMSVLAVEVPPFVREVYAGPVASQKDGPFTLTVLRGGKIWDLREQRLKPNEVRRVRVEFEVPCSVSLTVRSEDGGTPFKGVLAQDRFLFNWNHVPPPAEIDDETAERYGLMKVSGKIRHGRIPPGPRTLYLMSPGCEVIELEVNGSPGEVIDLGMFTLERSRANVMIQVSGRKPGQKYLAYLLQPGGLPVTGKGVPVSDDGSVRFENVTSGEYFASIAITPSGNTESTLFEITSNRGDWVVEVDVSELENDSPDSEEGGD